MAEIDTYDIEDDDDDAQPVSAPAQPPTATVTGGAESDALEDELPPPISAEGDPKPWLVTAAVCTALLAVSWLAGVQALAPIDGSEFGFGTRTAGFARTLVFLPLATLALGFGILSLAFIRQRPIGDATAMLAKCAAIASIGMLAWLAPVDMRVLKNTIHVIGPPLIAGALTIPVFRLHPRDAGLVAGFTVLGLVLLTLFALVIVWAVGAR